MSTARTITGTLFRVDGKPYNGFVRFSPWHNIPPRTVGSWAPLTVVSQESGEIWVTLYPGHYRVEVGTDSPFLITVPDVLPADAGDEPEALDISLLQQDGIDVPGGAYFYWGISTDPTVVAATVVDTFSVVKSGTIRGGKTFPSGGYKFFVWDDEFGSPMANRGFIDVRTELPMVMAGTDEGYTEVENGWYYQLVSIDSRAHRVYRTRNILNATIQIIVQK